MAAIQTTRRRLDRRRLISTVALALAVLGASAHCQTATQADRIVVSKAKRTMQLYHGDKFLKTFRIALGATPVGPKTRQGDHKTPEGTYHIDFRNAKSRFHLALHISYPNSHDRANARKQGVSPGGDIMIHGLPDRYAYVGSLHTKYDWTDGCIAVTNAEIEEIWGLVPIGTTVEIRP